MLLATRGGIFERMKQTEPITYQDELWYEVPIDKEVQGGFSGAPMFDENGSVVGMLSDSSGNMVSAIKVEVISRFLDGDLPFTVCRDHPSVAICIEQATRQAEEMAEDGNRTAQYHLGDDDYLSADASMLRRAAEGGFAPAQLAMGFRLKESKQWAEAARWFSLSAEQGHPQGMSQLALLHYYGHGVARDSKRAFHLMLRSARSGNRLCCKPDVGVSQIRTTTVLSSCFCVGQTVL